jgi:hypothetical protein
VQAGLQEIISNPFSRVSRNDLEAHFDAKFNRIEKNIQPAITRGRYRAQRPQNDSKPKVHQNASEREDWFGTLFGFGEEGEVNLFVSQNPEIQSFRS